MTENESFEFNLQESCTPFGALLVKQNENRIMANCDLLAKEHRTLCNDIWLKMQIIDPDFDPAVFGSIFFLMPIQTVTKGGVSYEERRCKAFPEALQSVTKRFENFFLEEGKEKRFLFLGVKPNCNQFDGVHAEHIELFRTSDDSIEIAVIVRDHFKNVFHIPEIYITVDKESETAKHPDLKPAINALQAALLKMYLTETMVCDKNYFRGFMLEECEIIEKVTFTHE